MKQEPVKNAKLPKYAAILAAMSASAGLLTGCAEIDYDDMKYGGIVCPYTDSDMYTTEETDKVTLAGDVAVDSETDSALADDAE